jgi:hypothetical protein
MAARLARLKARQDAGQAPVAKKKSKKKVSKKKAGASTTE